MFAAALALLLNLLAGGGDHGFVRGVTVSCQTWGWEWGSDGFAEELDELAGLGANWVSIHPYGRIHADGRVTWRGMDSTEPADWIVRPIREARKRGMAILIKPHLSYWGSPFAWRGAIEFPDPEARARFFETYRRWILAVARDARGADALVVGTELDLLVGEEAAWRGLIARVRERFGGSLTYAANWDRVEHVPFWDALDAVGVQAYFPISERELPDEAELLAGWERVLARLRPIHEATGKPVVFTELGYSASLEAASTPWKAHVTLGQRASEARELQERCLRVGLGVLERERAWLRGCFLWKWFVGESFEDDFQLDTPAVRAVLRRAWGPG